MKKEEVESLTQLIETLKQASSKLDDSFKKKDMREFKESKKEILKLQEKIKEVLE